MTDKLAGVEASAVSLLKEAVELDMAQRFSEALVCYRQGIQLLIDCLKGSQPGHSVICLFQYVTLIIIIYHCDHGRIISNMIAYYDHSFTELHKQIFFFLERHLAEIFNMLYL